MIEQGIIQLVQSSPAVAALCPNGGGYYGELPPDASLPNWSFIVVFTHPMYGLLSQPGLVNMRLQIDTYSENDNGNGTINLAAAIINVLSGYSGTLADPQATQVNAIFLLDQHDFFDAPRRNWRRLIEFEVIYYANSGTLS